MRNLSLSAAALALAISPLASVPAHAQNPLNSIFSCGASGNKQATGALAGAAIGGLLGNTTAGKKNKTSSTVLGAALGAAAGSYIGCRMQTSDQTKAEAAAQQALENGQSTTWSNPETGARGRTTVVSTSPYGSAAAQPQPVSMAGVRFAAGVEPMGPYYGAAGTYFAPNRVNLRGAPSTNANVVGRLQAGDNFEVMAKTRTAQGDWLMVGQNGVAIGYVAENVVRPAQPAYAGNRRGNQLCRTFDQTLTTGAGETETNRYTACQTASGEWVVQG